MNIAGLEACSLLDYPGLLSSVFFCQGCNYDCFYCHNRALIEPKSCITDYQEAQTFLQQRKGFIQAVVISGGEPSLQHDLMEFVEFIRNLGFAVKLDTNGSRPQVVSKLLEHDLLSYVAVDVKAPCERYQEIVGDKGDEILVRTSVSLLTEYQASHPGFSYEVRTTLAPTLGQEDLLCMVQSYPVVQHWYVQKYRIPKHFKANDEKRIILPQLSVGEVEKSLGLLRMYQPNLVIR